MYDINMEYYKVLWFLLLGSTWSALAAAAGIPICAPGLLSCGTAGCYSSLLSTCMEWHGRKQCQPTGILQQLNLMVSASADRRCPMGYLNTCGKDFCSNDELCSVQGCVQMQAANGSTAAAAAAAMWQAGESPEVMCYAARSTSAACKSDSSALQPVPCNSIGVASVPGVACFQSTLFNCAASGFREVVHTCRGLAMVADAVRDAINSSVAAHEAHVAAEANASTAAVAAAAADGDDDDDVYEEPRRPRRMRRPELDQPLLQPVFEGLANVVSNVSKSIFNISVPPVGSQRGAALAGSSSSSNMQAGGGSGFQLVPPAGIKNAAAGSSGRMPACFLAAALFSVLLLA